jgi:hypothetical protein
MVADIAVDASEIDAAVALEVHSPNLRADVV